ncbi:phage major capsid protein [Paracoccus nototheniae]|uniref:Phage major capsid protein n=1 Tax=Paracoccus nototheniae TaxID=2489002 RepID=A0ABW4DX70_9RHOB|nr:phage major capsid protein [Paracoccus nototheniae]
MTLKELIEKRARLMAEARSALDEIKGNTDEARAAELDTRHDTIMAEFDRVETLIKREQRLAEIESRAAAQDDEQRGRQRPLSDGEGRGTDDGDELTYRQAFHRFITRGGDITELSTEERAVLRAGAQASAEMRAQSTLTQAGGGYTVPVELANQIIISMAAWGPMYDESVTTAMNTSSGNRILIPTVDDTGINAEKHVEGADLVDDGGKDVTFGQKALDAYVYDTEFIRWSMELGQDSIFNFEQLLGSLLGERLGRTANRELTIGDGVDDPHGVVTASSLGRTAASATALTSDEIIDLIHSVNPAYRGAPKVGFMFNDLTLASIRKLKDGEGRYIWSGGDIQNGVPGTLLGYRYRINQAMAPIATGNRTMIFGDFGKYFVRKVGSPIIGVLRERFWPNLGIAGLIRFDGELGDTAAIKHLVQA